MVDNFLRKRSIANDMNARNSGSGVRRGAAAIFLPAICVALLAATLGVGIAVADTVILKQGARQIEGSIVKETDDTITIQTTYSVFPLKKSLIKEIIRSESQGESERRGDLELRRDNYSDAYENYRLALDEDPGNERISEKLKTVADALLKEEQRQYALQIEDAEKDIAEKRFPNGISKIRAILNQVEEGPFRQQVIRRLARAHFDYAQELKDIVQLEPARD